jgi:maltodextrin utilization protein YvdJ
MNLSTSCLLTSQIVLFIQIIVKGFTALIAWVTLIELEFAFIKFKESNYFDCISCLNSLLLCLLPH